jgi:hypothetical protein
MLTIVRLETLAWYIVWHEPHQNDAAPQHWKESQFWHNFCGALAPGQNKRTKLIYAKISGLNWGKISFLLNLADSTLKS